MNADAIRQLYDYHFSENRKVWDSAARLPYEQFIQGSNYSHGSVRDQLVHLMNVDQIWFSELQNAEFQEPSFPANTDDRQAIRAHWDQVEAGMRAYLAALRDEMLSEKPIRVVDEDEDLIAWQVLLHVINHGTDHRAQTLRLMNDLGVKTVSQDFIFYVYEQQKERGQ